MVKVLFFILSISTFAFASGQEHSTDIVQRTVNFLIFAGVIWYLIAEPLKGYFASRSKAIADEMSKVQDKLRESANIKKDALAKVSASEKFAQELAQHSSKENKILSDNILSQCEADILTMAKQQDSLMEFEQRKMVRQVVEETLSKALSEVDSDFDKESMANIILKKVA